jgi:outer membrane murein-binding lipoprotein Lpp
MSFKESEDADACERVAVFEEKANQHSHVIVMLQSKVTQLSTDFGRLVGEVSALRSAAVGMQTLCEEVSAPKTQITAVLRDSVVQQLLTELGELRRDVSALKMQIIAM